MKAIYRNKSGTKFYRQMSPAGTYPDKRYCHWILWQPVRRFFGLFWVRSGKPFWLDSEGFYPV